MTKTPSGSMQILRLGLAILMLFALPAQASPAGDTYSFDHQLGAFIDDIFQCFSVHMAGMNDNIVTFDGMTEFLDPYVNGTQPFIFEFETASGVPGNPQVEINTIAGDDLFPEGFEDPETGTSLTDACVEIGIDDVLESDPPANVVSAQLEFHDDNGPLFPDPIDITSAFPGDPWNGRLSIVFPGLAGFNIREVRLTLELAESPNTIFADGFETGNTASWSQQSP